MPDRSDRDRSGRSDFSEPRDSWAGLRVALIAALLLAAAVAGGRWYLAHSGTLPSALTSRASSTVQDTPPMRDQGPATAPATAPAAAQGDLPAQDPATPPEDPQALPPAVSQVDSSPQAADAAQAPATAEAEAPAPAAERHAKRIRKKTVFTGHSSPPMTALGGGVQVVKARQGQSIVGICVEKFNGCSSVLLNRIIELNPRIADAHHLQAGQRIFLPVLGSQREAGDRRPSGE